MRFGWFGGALFVALIALSGGCASGPAATARPTASTVPQALPSSFALPSPESSGPAGSSIPTPTPVVLQATGATHNVVISGGTMRFVARDGGRARCQSVADSEAVAGITALELGELGPGTLRATLAVQTSAVASVELFIDGGDLVEGSFQPFWTGPIKVTEPHGDGAVGTVTFSGLKLEADAGSKPGLSPLPGVDEWPASLSGTMSWSCEPWTIPVPSGGAPSPSIAP